MNPPLLRVSRPVAACARCRAAKIKCDGKLPACTSCIRSNRAFECSNSNDQFSRGKERSYVAALESRIEKLERQVAETRRNQHSYAVAAAHAAAVAASKTSDKTDILSSVLIDSLDINIPSTKDSRTHKEAVKVDDLVSGFGLLAVNATTRDFDGLSNSLTFAKIILAASMRHDMSKVRPSPLPPHHVTLGRAQFYLNTIFILLPFMDETSMYASIDAVYDHANNTSSPFDHFMVRIILAVTSASMSEKRGDALYLDGIGHVREALEFAEDLFHPGTLQCIQALLLLAEYASFEPTYFDNWTLVGAASRVMLDLGLHQDPGRILRSKISRDQLELRRRIFYSIYSLDRSLSSLVGRAFSFSDDSCNVALPFASEVAAQTSSSSSPASSSPAESAHLPANAYDAARDFFRLRQIQSRFYTELHQTSRTPMEFPYRCIWRYYHEMSSWYTSLAPTPNQEVTRYFSTELLYGYISLLAPSPRCPNLSPYAIRLVFEHCIAFVDCMEDVHQFELPDPTGYRTAVISQSIMRLSNAARLFVDILSGNPFDLFESHPRPPSVSGGANSRKKKPAPIPSMMEGDPSPFLPDVHAPEIPHPTAFYALLRLRQPSSQSPPAPDYHLLSQGRTLSERVNGFFLDSMQENAGSHFSSRALSTIDKATRMLKVFGEKFDMMMFYHTFEQLQRPLLPRLREARASFKTRFCGALSATMPIHDLPGSQFTSQVVDSKPSVQSSSMPVSSSTLASSGMGQNNTFTISQPSLHSHPSSRIGHGQFTYPAGNIDPDPTAPSQPQPLQSAHPLSQSSQNGPHFAPTPVSGSAVPSFPLTTIQTLQTFSPSGSLPTNGVLHSSYPHSLPPDTPISQVNTPLAAQPCGPDFSAPAHQHRIAPTSNGRLANPISPDQVRTQHSNSGSIQPLAQDPTQHPPLYPTHPPIHRYHSDTLLSQHPQTAGQGDSLHQGQQNHYQVSSTSHPLHVSTFTPTGAHPLHNFSPASMNPAWGQQTDMHQGWKYHHQNQQQPLHNTPVDPHPGFAGSIPGSRLPQHVEPVSHSGLPPSSHAHDSAISVSTAQGPSSAVDDWKTWSSPAASRTGLSSSFGTVPFQPVADANMVNNASMFSSHQQHHHHHNSSFSHATPTPHTHSDVGQLTPHGASFNGSFSNGLLMPWEAVPTDIDVGLDDYDLIDFDV